MVTQPTPSTARAGLDNAALRPLHRDDAQAIRAKAKALASGRLRVVVKSAVTRGLDWPSGWPSYCIPESIVLSVGFKGLDYDHEVPLSSARVPCEGQFYLDVQVEKNMARPGYEADWEIEDWVQAEFMGGRLVAMDNRPVGGGK